MIVSADEIWRELDPKFKESCTVGTSSLIVPMELWDEARRKLDAGRINNFPQGISAKEFDKEKEIKDSQEMTEDPIDAEIHNVCKENIVDVLKIAFKIAKGEVYEGQDQWDAVKFLIAMYRTKKAFRTKIAKDKINNDDVSEDTTRVKSNNSSHGEWIADTTTLGTFSYPDGESLMNPEEMDKKIKEICETLINVNQELGMINNDHLISDSMKKQMSMSKQMTQEIEEIEDLKKTHKEAVNVHEKIKSLRDERDNIACLFPLQGYLFHNFVDIKALIYLDTLTFGKFLDVLTATRRRVVQINDEIYYLEHPNRDLEDDCDDDSCK